jgi:hypothetical protein
VELDVEQEVGVKRARLAAELVETIFLVLHRRMNDEAANDLVVAARDEVAEAHDRTREVERQRVARVLVDRGVRVWIGVIAGGRHVVAVVVVIGVAVVVVITGVVELDVNDRVTAETRGFTAQARETLLLLTHVSVHVDEAEHLARALRAALEHEHAVGRGLKLGRDGALGLVLVIVIVVVIGDGRRRVRRLRVRGGAHVMTTGAGHGHQRDEDRAENSCSHDVFPSFS